MKSINNKITTNTRVVIDLLTNYRDTFQALRELINNAIQANAKTIELNIEYSDSIASKAPIESIEILDDGYGVPFSEFDKRILEIGTTVKHKGQGIGRFSALQIGDLMHIETIAHDAQKKEYSKTKFGIDSLDLKNTQFEETEFKVDYEYLGEKHIKSYYKVRIENLHHNKQEKVSKRNKLTEGFLKENINQSVFENYPFEVFNNKVTFKVNGTPLKREDFVIGKPTTKKTIYTDRKGNEHEMSFYFYNIKSDLNKVKVFFQIENAGIKSVAHEYTYSSDWYTPDLKTWFIYIESPILDSDLFRNVDLEALGEEEIKKLKNHTKEVINDFFQAKNKRFDKFIRNLEEDKYYPYNGYQPASKSQEVLFKKVAYIVEDEHQLISKDNKIRDFLYQLLDKAISNGYIEDIFKKVLKLSEEGIEKFHCLLEKTDLEEVVHFASQVSDKLEFLDFLHELTYGDLSKVLKERSQLHKIIEKQLWIFGENYNGSPKLWSDKKIGNILTELRNKYFSYEPTEEDENLIKQNGEGLDDITDLFFFNEKIIDNGAKEIMIVELKSPKCAISNKELEQANRYAFTIEQHSGLPNEKVKYKVLLISSRLTKYAKSQVKSRRDTYDKPFLYDVKTEKDVEVYVMEWSELMELNKRRLGYLSTQLQVKDKTVRTKFEEEYSELIDEKISSRLTLVK
jgi:hypothetical protein